MKLVFVCEGLDAVSARAQPWKHVIEVAKRVQGLGNAVQVVSDNQNKLSVNDEIEGVPIQRVGRKRFLLDAERLNHIAHGDFDLVNWHGSDTWSSFYLARLKRTVPATTAVWTLHSGPVAMRDLRRLNFREKLQLYKYWNNLLNSALPSRIIRRWIRNSGLKHIIALSSRLERHLKTVDNGSTAISVIRSGVDTKQFHPLNSDDSRDLLGLPHRDAIILYYGPLSSFRGVDTLTRAMSIIKKDVSRARLLLLGRGSARKAKQRNVFSNMIELHEEILDAATLVRYLAAADLVALPFKFWPQVECPLTVLEAMAMGKPVISTFTGAIPEIISSGENGILVPPAQPSLLAQKSVELLLNPDLSRRLGTNARRHIETHYDWNQIVKQTMTVFNAALKNS